MAVLPPTSSEVAEEEMEKRGVALYEVVALEFDTLRKPKIESTLTSAGERSSVSVEL